MDGLPYTPHYDSVVMYGEFQGCPQLVPHDAERDARSLLFFQSGAEVGPNYFIIAKKSLAEFNCFDWDKLSCFVLIGTSFRVLH